MFVHKREKHTFKNTINITCPSCLNNFNSPIFNPRLNKYYDRCEDCRDLANKLSTRPLTNNTYVYGLNKERFFIDKGKNIKVCSVYNCLNSFNCNDHKDIDIVQCFGSKCNNCYVKNKFNFCDLCRNMNDKSKNIKRENVKQFKKELGGKCVDCGFNELFYLEFDHIDPNKKTIQITRSPKNKWENEKFNLELRCGRCHRIKSNKEMKIFTNTDISNKYAKSKIDKKEFVKEIKKLIGNCQICGWTYENKDEMCCALDFDHVSDEKYKQISRLYTFKKETIVNEIRKTRLLCRHCHELNTCLQRGGKSLLFYYSKEEIDDFKKMLFDQEKIKHDQTEINVILTNLKFL